MFEFLLPESGKRHPLRSFSRKELREIREFAKTDVSFIDYQDEVLRRGYPELYAKEESFDDMPGADIAHIVFVTMGYSTGGEDAVKNYLTSGGGELSEPITAGPVKKPKN